METVANLHVSNLDKFNDAKQVIWTVVYSNIDYMNTFSDIIRERFGDSINEIGYDFNRYTISLRPNRVMGNVELNGIMSVAVMDFLEYTRDRNIIPDNIYEICKNKIAMLFNITLNSNERIDIKL